MKNRLPRTSPEERRALESRVIELIEIHQSSMEGAIKWIIKEYPNIRKVTRLKYNRNNFFKELGILDLLPFYHNAISNREQFHIKNEKYKLLIKKLGL